ncbi:MAG: tRNA (N6-isopentenyl adenosine(37)-C2)-methylthiotransferase MiaB [Rickettsiales bacterium]
MQKLFIKTYGCQMNVYDSVKMEELLKPHGYEMTLNSKEADLVILNTCHIREKAAEKVYSELGRIKKNSTKKRTIAVAGCVAQAEGEEIFRRAPYVDLVVGPQSYQNLPELLAKVARNDKRVIDLDFPEDSKFDQIGGEIKHQGIAAFLSVQEGCDKFCHFCVVPYTRGAEYSRTVSEVRREAIKLVAMGAKELTLLGQNVSGYHGLADDSNTWSLGKLIKNLAQIDGLERIRYMTSHPRDMVDEELFEVHAREPKLMPFLHLPIQAGSNRTLEAMNRKHTREFYLELIAKFRKARPDMAFSSDFIVGFPGETEEDFQETMKIVEEVGYSQCYSFKYSPRPGTPAAVSADQVLEEVKSERLQRLQALIIRKQMEFNQACVGKTLPVLFVDQAKKDGQIQGKSPYMQTVVVEGGGSALYGQTREVLITRAGQNSIQGELVE